MAEFKIIYYETENGECPIEEYLHSLDDKVAAKVYGMLGLLEELGNRLPMPYSKPLEDGILELRVKHKDGLIRVLYFFFVEKEIVLTNGFNKKTRKTPRREIEKAKRYRANYIARRKKDENISR